MKSISKLTITLSTIALLMGICSAMDASAPGKGAIHHLRRLEEGSQLAGGYQTVPNFESDEE
eukprot:CAMPEP_0116142006 /NCGR_PEP_ID=MMETSP0329-20121206/14677_1 /TAXON_ID=697910 /ORGANISM="Pseudo-nitzschia arenysensis, Strain B593" /LENGTH=61 /DNA_ID=CAMNT_0003637211 /DNA_START=62 /DNA_END=244 /DNA_ORIENTATION=-